MFKLKFKGVRKAKKIMSMLWGALSEVDKRKHYVVDSYDIQDDDEDIIEIYPTKDESGFIIETTKINNYYKTPYARLCPFLLAKSRSYMTDLIYPIKEHIHRINVDGFYTDIPLHKEKKEALGELKYEGFNPNGIIKNCTNKVIIHKPNF